MSNKLLLLVPFILAGAIACDVFDDNYSGENRLGLTATVQFLELEGGCWTLLAADGTRYEPINLPEAFRQDGLGVRADVRSRDDVATVCQVGRIIEIISIQAG